MKSIKSLPDRLYETARQDLGEGKNSSATGAAGEKAAYCVDGAVLYCTMGSAQSFLRVEDHGLHLTDCPGAHDGDREPNKNIFPFGKCRLKDNNPCNPAPVARWLLADEYLAIGSCHSAKLEQYQKITQLKRQAAEEIKALYGAPVTLPRQALFSISPELRRDILRAALTANQEQERISLFCARFLENKAEFTECFLLLEEAARRGQKAMERMREAFAAAESYQAEAARQYQKKADLLAAGEMSNEKNSLPAMGEYAKSVMKHAQEALTQGLKNDATVNLREIFAQAEQQADAIGQKARAAIERAEAITETETADQGCQITTDSILPCRLGGLIHF